MTALKRLIQILLLAATAALPWCTGFVTTPESNRVRFAVTGNTSPESPFAGFTEKLPDLVRNINIENPVLVIHSGNMIHGGFMWMGINEKDLKRQYESFFSQMRGVSSILYTLAGDKDLYNKSSLVYREYSKNTVFYSFNYGSIHFAMIPLVDMADQPVKSQIAWLEKDLAMHKGYQTIFIVTHTPIFCTQCGRIPERTGEALHSLFLKHKVKAVISGNCNRFSDMTRDGIRYIVAGCGGFIAEEKYRNLAQFYVISYNGYDVTIEAKKF